MHPGRSHVGARQQLDTSCHVKIDPGSVVGIEQPETRAPLQRGPISGKVKALLMMCGYLQHSGVLMVLMLIPLTDLSLMQNV